MSPGGQSNLLLIRRLLHPSILDFDPIRGRFFAQVLGRWGFVNSQSRAPIADDITTVGTVTGTADGDHCAGPILLLAIKQSTTRSISS